MCSGNVRIHFFLALLQYVWMNVLAFVPGNEMSCNVRWFASPSSRMLSRHDITNLRVKRYGPQEDKMQNLDPDAPFFDDFEDWEKKDNERVAQQQKDFNQLLQKMIDTDVSAIPSLLTSNLDLLLSMRGYEGETLIKEAIEEAEKSGDSDYAARVGGSLDYMLSFLTEFVQQAEEMDNVNKELLGKIVLLANDATKNEDDLDDLLSKEKENFNPSFLRHIEGECQRVASSATMTKEAAHMLQILRIIQTRVLEELGSDLGEGAAVLSQLLGYDDDDERVAVLNAGLTVRGVEFAQEMISLTQEALEGFKRYPEGQVDPELVRRVRIINDELKEYINDETNDAWM